LLFLLPALLAIPATASASDVIVQGTTDVRDAGLLEDVIEPGFHKAYPQYTLKYIAVGTGQAIANAKAGQGDALLVHAPSQEKTFVEEGYSLERRGRAVFFSDYVIPGPLGDPAGVLAGAPHNAALAFELIARAGAEGKANFVSRGDNSGTNTQEKAIWKLTHVELNKNGEPGKAGTSTDASWYHKAGAGQAETVLLTQQCPFTGGGCYEMTDRGTYNRLVANGAVTGLQIVSQDNEASAPGGQNLLTNPFTVYAINPEKEPAVDINVEGAKALTEYLTSAGFQKRLASYPNRESPAFFADAHAKMTGPHLTRTVRAGTKLTVKGSVENLLPGSPAIAGEPILLQRLTKLRPAETPSYMTIAVGITHGNGSYSLTAGASRSGALRVELPTTLDYPPLTIEPLISSGALTTSDLNVGKVTVHSKVGVKAPVRRGRVVTLRGSVGPTRERGVEARLVVQGRKQGTKSFRALRKVRPKIGAAYALHVKLGNGKWKLRVRYQDPGAVVPATSRAVSVSVR
jgi:tungstate transport system substrate-binding protein